MISGRNDTYFTVSEFAGMVGRSEKTVMNWRTEGRIQFVSLCGVPLIALSMVENLITGAAPAGADAGGAALRMINRTSRDGRRAAPERRAPRSSPSFSPAADPGYVPGPDRAGTSPEPRS